MLFDSLKLLTIGQNIAADAPHDIAAEALYNIVAEALHNIT